MKDNLTTIIMALAGSLFAVSIVSAQDFYKWVDEQGVTHYGEVRPAEHVEHQKLMFPDQYIAPANPEDDYYSIQNQLDRTLARSEQIARQRPLKVVEPPQASSVALIDNRGGFFVPNRAPYYSSFNNDKRLNARQLQDQSGTRIGNQLRRQGVIPGGRQAKYQSGPQRPRSGLQIR